MIADIIRAVIISGGALLGGWIVGTAVKEWLTAKNDKVAPPRTLVMPWWSAIAWLLFIIGAMIPHIRQWGTTDVLLEQAILNTLAILIGIRAVLHMRHIHKQEED